MLAYLWAYYKELDLARRNYGWGPTPINFAEIYAWTNLRNIRLDPWELDALLRLDGLFLSVMAENKGKANDS